MKNSFGSAVTITLFGESHGPAIGAVLDGLPAGFEVDIKRIEQDMDQRKAKGKISTQRHEGDAVQVLSGLFENKTTGTPLTLLIANTSQKSKDYSALQYALRPGHADFTAFEKYGGHQDYRGGGHFSGRITAPLVAAGSICRQILESRGVFIGTHIQKLHHLEDTPFSQDPLQLKQEILQVNQLDFAVLSKKAGQEMVAFIEQAAAQKDSVGGILESAVTGLPAGLGEPFFDSAESVLSHLLFSIPAVKGVSFGLGFEFSGLYGSQANDPFIIKDGKIETSTNNNGGINGGITNGMPLLIHTCIKPTPSIFQPQHSVRYDTKKEEELTILGRHDPAIIHRARVVADSAIAIGLLDLWIQREGTLAFQKGFSS